MSYHLQLDRLIDAPRERVWEAWSKPEHVRRWFTPASLSTGVCELDFRVGGAWTHVMVMPDGSSHSSRSRYTELDPPGRLAFETVIEEFSNSQVVTVVTLEDEGGKTRLRVDQRFEGPVPESDARQGWGSSLDQLAAVAAELAGAH